MPAQNVRVPTGSCGDVMYVYTSITAGSKGEVDHRSAPCRNG
jgi:hypothetical protein